jgi:CHAT domain-containing protein
MQYSNALVLEIFKQTDALKMGIFEQKELVSTLRHYSQCQVSFTEIDSLCREIISILNKADAKGALEPNLFKSLMKTGQLLWDHLLTRPVKDKLRARQISDLILSIDEELVSIPWELLYDGSNFLCLSFNLGRLVRTKKEIAQVQYRSFSSTPKMLILANPTNDLKSAYREGLNIKDQFDRKRNSVHIDFKSTSIDTLYVKKNLRDYDLVHFAGHCEYIPDNPKESGWTLSDGVFSVQDILAMATTVSLPSLVFSNACYSALSQEMTYSLASAFLFSGVRHYIGAIRKIEDPISLAFAKEFYAQLIAGKSVGESLRLSRLKLIKEYGITTIHWASYLLYGDPIFVLFRAKVKEPRIKLKRNIIRYRKPVALFSLAVAIISICIYLYMWLPTLNPSTYALFLKSRKLFGQGRNYEVVLTSSQIIQEHPGFLAAYPLLAESYHKLGKRDLALKYYFEYARYSEKKKQKKHLTSAYLGIGWIYQLNGEYPKAFDFYNKALDLGKQNKDKLSEATALRRLAEWHTDKKEYDKALELLTKSSEIDRERQHIYQHRYNLACDYFDIGLVFTNKDDFVPAREFYTKSYLLFEKLNLKNELSDCYFNLGEICLYEKQYQRALDYYLQGLKLDQMQGNKLNLAGDYNMIGELYIEMGDLENAEKYFLEAVSASQKISAQPELVSAYYDLGILYKKANKKNKAREFLRLAQEIYRTIDESRYQEIKQLLLELN